MSFLPITKKEIESLGWDYVDIIIVSGDAYVDHPSFGHAVIGRVLEKNGFRVAIIPQPNWRDDLRDFKKLGQPRLFFGVSAGVMDSMVNHYTALKRKRSDDAYTPGAESGYRPDYATIVYSNILKEIYPQTPIIIGGIENKFLTTENRMMTINMLTHNPYFFKGTVKENLHIANPNATNEEIDSLLRDVHLYDFLYEQPLRKI